MGKITEALKKAAEERMARLEKLDQHDEVKYHFVAQKTIESKIDPRVVVFTSPCRLWQSNTAYSAQILWH